MKFKWTIEELNTRSDIDMLKALIVERMGSGLNIYAPLYKRLTALHKKLDNKESLTTAEVTGEVGYINFYTKKHYLVEKLTELEKRRDSLPLHDSKATALNKRIQRLTDKINKTS